VEDLGWMLNIGVCRMHLNLESVRVRGGLWSGPEVYTEEFERLSKERVRAFCEEFPQHAEMWRLLGFDV